MSQCCLVFAKYGRKSTLYFFQDTVEVLVIMDPTVLPTQLAIYDVLIFS